MSEGPEVPIDGVEFGEESSSESGVSIAKLLTKLVMSILFLVALGAASALGAITLKPELVEYLSFLPDVGASGNTAACGYSKSNDGCCSAGATVASSSCCATNGACSTFATSEAGCELQCSEPESSVPEVAEVADMEAAAVMSEFLETAE